MWWQPLCHRRRRQKATEVRSRGAATPTRPQTAAAGAPRCDSFCTASPRCPSHTVRRRSPTPRCGGPPSVLPCHRGHTDARRVRTRRGAPEPIGAGRVGDADDSWQHAAMKVTKTVTLSATDRTVTERPSGGTDYLEWREVSHTYRLPEGWDLGRLQDLLTSNGFAPPDVRTDTSPWLGQAVTRRELTAAADGRACPSPAREHPRRGPQPPPHRHVSGRGASW